MESCFSTHTAPIHTYPPAASKLTRRHQRKEAAISSRPNDGDDGDKPKSGELAVLCCPLKGAGRSGPLGRRPERFVESGGPRAASEPRADTALS